MNVDYGIQVIEGLPGSGKSFFCIDRLLLPAIMKAHRPVYTNLPVRWRVLRAFLYKRGGSKLAGLIRPLDADGLMRFAERFDTRARLVETLKAQRVEHYRVDALADEQLGPTITDGEGLNWIPRGSVIIVDEAQKWFPMAHQSKEPLAFMRYLSMHRHAWHKLFFVTQERGRISKNIRAMADKFWVVRNQKEDCLAWGIRFKHLGLNAFGYAAYTSDQLLGRTNETKPAENYVVFPTMPNKRWIFRLYDSFTQSGSVACAAKELEAIRKEVGVYDMETKPQSVPVVSAPRKRSALFLALLAFVGGGAVGFSFPKASSTVVVPDGSISVPQLSAVSKDAAVLGKTLVPVGESLDGWSVAAVDAGLGVALLERDGFVWVCSPNRKPERLGRTDIVAGAARFAMVTAQGSNGAPNSPNPAGRPGGGSIDAPESGRRLVIPSGRPTN